MLSFNLCCRRVLLFRINAAYYCTNQSPTLKHGLGEKLKWIPPKKVILEEQSGDCSPLQEIDLTDCTNEFKKSEELKTANEMVKKMFSFEFMRRGEMMKEIRLRAMISVQRHKLDFDSLETKIAKLTIVIRNLQIHMETHPNDMRNRAVLIEVIGKRRKYLKWLRMRDYKRFEWILETLDIIYKPLPSVPQDLTREIALEKLAEKYCNDLRERKMSEYRKQLESQQMGFLREKLEVMKTIRREEEECGEVVSITQEDMDKVTMQMKELEGREPKQIQTHRRERISA